MMKVHDRGKWAQRIGLAACVAAALLPLTPAGAVDLTLSAQVINEALLFGQSRIDTERRRFHLLYRIPISTGEVDFIEVVTPYRRVVLAAEDHVASGDRGFGYRQALALLDATPQQLDLHVDLTFNPLNVYVGMPDYRITLAGPDGRTLEPRTVAQYSRYTPRISERPSVTAVPGAPLQPGRSQPLIGGTIVTGFDGRLLLPKATYDVVIRLAGKVVSTARVDFSKMR
jgi:hypothetical protein